MFYHIKQSPGDIHTCLDCASNSLMKVLDNVDNIALLFNFVWNNHRVLQYWANDANFSLEKTKKPI